MRAPEFIPRRRIHTQNRARGQSVSILLLLLLLSLCFFTPNQAGARQHYLWTELDAVPAGDPLITNGTFADLFEKCSPAVVNIYTTQPVYARLIFPGWDFHVGDREALGSGFLIDKRGFILTNNHVVDRARDVKVMLSDGRNFEARVLATSKERELAVIQIDVYNPLPALPLGNSTNRLRTGEWVMAIGNPFGLENSMSVGVVSAQGRALGLLKDEQDNFIQTDASINPGNSGGPLINVYGEVVGINTAVAQPANSIGFAVPIDSAKEWLETLDLSSTANREDGNPLR